MKLKHLIQRLPTSNALSRLSPSHKIRLRDEGIFCSAGNVSGGQRSRDGRVVHAWSLRVHSGNLHLCGLPGGPAGMANILLPRLRIFQLSTGALPSRKLLAGRNSPLESTQQLRASLSGPVEHLGSLSRFAVLPAFSAVVVAGRFLFAPPIPGGNGNVLPGQPLDWQSSRSLGRRRRLRLQRTDSELPDVAEQHRGAGLDALDHFGFATSLDRRRAQHRRGRCCRRDADALRRTGNHIADLDNAGGFGRRPIVSRASCRRKTVEAICRGCIPGRGDQRGAVAPVSGFAQSRAPRCGLR